MCLSVYSITDVLLLAKFSVCVRVRVNFNVFAVCCRVSLVSVMSTVKTADCAVTGRVSKPRLFIPDQLLLNLSLTSGDKDNICIGLWVKRGKRQ